MKMPFERVDGKEYLALCVKVVAALRDVTASGTTGGIRALDGDFLPVSNVNDARWLVSMFETPIGTAVSLTKLTESGMMLALVRRVDDLKEERLN